MEGEGGRDILMSWKEGRGICIYTDQRMWRKGYGLAPAGRQRGYLTGAGNQENGNRCQEGEGDCNDKRVSAEGWVVGGSN